MNFGAMLITSKIDLQIFNISCHYMEFSMITDTKMISPPLSHLISGLEFIFNHFLYLKNLIYMMRRLLLPNSNESSHLI